MIVTAQYDGKIDEARQERIHKVFDRCGVRSGVQSPIMPGASYSDVDWTSNEDDTWTRLRIYVKDNEQERAERLASELRGCGMIVGIGSDDMQWDD